MWLQSLLNYPSQEMPKIKGGAVNKKIMNCMNFEIQIINSWVWKDSIEEILKLVCDPLRVVLLTSLKRFIIEENLK